MRVLNPDFKYRPSPNDPSAAPGVHSSQGHAIACTADAPPRVQTLDIHASHGIQKAWKGERVGIARGKAWGCTRGQQPHMDFNSWPRGSLIKYVRNIVRRPHNRIRKAKYVTNSLLSPAREGIEWRRDRKPNRYLIHSTRVYRMFRKS